MAAFVRSFQAPAATADLLQPVQACDYDDYYTLITTILTVLCVYGRLENLQL
jgi:hypothetical protein